MKRPFVIAPARPRGFSLIEVCLALGLVSFGIVALLGLMEAGLAAERRAGDEVSSARVLATVIDDFQGAARPPENVSLLPSSRTATPRFALPLPAAGDGTVESTLAVDAEGNPADAADAAAYVVHYRVTPPSAAEGLFAPYRIHVCVAWPGAAQFQGSESSLKLLKARGSVEAVVEVNRG